MSVVVALAAAGASGSRAPLTLLLLGGIAVIVRGLLLVTNHRGVLDALAAAERSTLRAKIGFPNETRYGGGALIVIGLAWIAVGVEGLVALVG